MTELVQVGKGPNRGYLLVEADHPRAAPRLPPQPHARAGTFADAPSVGRVRAVLTHRWQSAQAMSTSAGRQLSTTQYALKLLVEDGVAERLIVEGNRGIRGHAQVFYRLKGEDE